MPELPKIPVGLATKLGLIVSAVMGILTVVTLVLNGDYTEETITSLVAAVVVLYKVLDGRYNQAVATVVTGAVPTGEVPTDAELDEAFPEEAPEDPVLPGALRRE